MEMGIAEFPQQMYNKKRRQKLALRLSQLVHKAAGLNLERRQIDRSTDDCPRHAPLRNRSICAFSLRSCERSKHFLDRVLRGGAGRDEAEWTSTPLQSTSQDEHEQRFLEQSDCVGSESRQRHCSRNQTISKALVEEESADEAVESGAEASAERKGMPRHRHSAVVSKVLADVRKGLQQLGSDTEGAHTVDWEEAKRMGESGTPEEDWGLDSELKDVGWGPGRGQMEACITNEWDEAFPDDAERWKRTSYHDDDVAPEGYENEYVYANQSWKKYPPMLLASIRVLNTETGLNMSLEPTPNTWDPDLYRPTRLYRPLRQIVREMSEERYIARERRGLVPLRNRTYERLGRELLEVCRRGASPAEDGAGWVDGVVNASDVEAAMELVKRGADVKRTDEFGQTALHLLCRADAPEELIAALLDAGARVHVRDLAGRTALHAAVEFLGEARPRSVAVVQLLLARGAKPDAATENGLTCVAAAEDSLFRSEVLGGRNSGTAAAARKVVEMLGGDTAAGMRLWIQAVHRTAERQQHKLNAAREAAAALAKDAAQRAAYVPPSMWDDEEGQGMSD